jgi:hypothetical protein
MELSSFTWFIVLWAVILVLSILSRSMVANLCLIFCCVLGYALALELTGITENVRYGIIAVFLMIAGFATIQIALGVKKV